MKALDLFCGAGGLAIGFRKAGFEVTGVDKNASAAETFEINRIGDFIEADLSKVVIEQDHYDMILGGPPCKPWAAVNLVRRGIEHHDYYLLSKYFKHVQMHRPAAFLLENVPAVANSSLLRKNIAKIRKLGYSVEGQFVRYSEFGAPTRRRRYILFGIKRASAKTFFEKLAHFKRCPRTTRDVIWYLRNREKGSVRDHDWPDLQTIDKYREYYEESKYGWYILKWKEPAPSFGNVMKTYILHPDSFNGGTTRVISVKEAMLIMGFNRSFNFPMKCGMGPRYQMVADSVSPEFSIVAGKVAREMIEDVSQDGTGN